MLIKHYIIKKKLKKEMFFYHIKKKMVTIYQLLIHPKILSQRNQMYDYEF